MLKKFFSKKLLLIAISLFFFTVYINSLTDSRLALWRTGDQIYSFYNTVAENYQALVRRFTRNNNLDSNTQSFLPPTANLAASINLQLAQEEEEYKQEQIETTYNEEINFNQIQQIQLIPAAINEFSATNESSTTNKSNETNGTNESNKSNETNLTNGSNGTEITLQPKNNVVINNVVIPTLAPQLTIQQQPTAQNPQPIIAVSFGGGISPAQNSPAAETKAKDKCDPSNFATTTIPKILISEIQYESTQTNASGTQIDADKNTTDEYIELYNPNDTAVNLQCFELRKYTSGSKDTPPLIPKSKFEGTIASYSFFLISHPDVKDKYSADLTYSQSYSFTKNNVLLLIDPTDKEIDKIGFGDKQDKILDFEAAPYLTTSDAESPEHQRGIINGVIERINLTDIDNNAQDFWQNQPNPENFKSPSREPRPDFVNLRNLKIAGLQSLFDQENSVLILTFQEAQLPISSQNYDYKLLFSTSTFFNTFFLSDFGSTTTLPQPQFNGATTTLRAQLSKCPTDASLYYVGLSLSDKLAASNKTPFSTTTIDLSGLCQKEQPSKDHSQDNTASTQEGRVVIAEVAIASASSTKDEYVELYNPNSFPVSLNGFSLVKVNKNNQEQTIIPTSKFKGVIQPFSFFLTANQTAILGILPDLRWAKSYDLAKDNSIKFLDAVGEVMDLVGWGKAKQFEVTPSINNPTLLALQRKAGVASNKESLGGEEKNYGNSFDSDNNKEDFVLVDSAPQNSDFKEIPPDYPTQFIAETQNATVTLGFVSPYQYFGEGAYELRYSSSTMSNVEIVANWQKLPLLPLQLPLLKVGGYIEKVEFDACGQNSNPSLAAGEWLILATVKDGSLLGFSKTQLSDSPSCPQPIAPLPVNNVSLTVDHLLAQVCEPILHEIEIKNQELNNQLSFSPGTHYPSYATRTYFKLLPQQTLSQSVKHSASCNTPPQETYTYQFSAQSIQADGVPTELSTSQYSETLSSHPLNPTVKNFQFQLPSNIMKLVISFKAKKEPFGFEVFKSLLEIIIE